MTSSRALGVISSVISDIESYKITLPPKATGWGSEIQALIVAQLRNVRRTGVRLTQRAVPPYTAIVFFPTTLQDTEKQYNDASARNYPAYIHRTLRAGMIP